MLGHEAAATALPRLVARASPAAAPGRGLRVDRVVRVRARRASRTERSASRREVAPAAAPRRPRRPRVPGGSRPSAARTRPTRRARAGAPAHARCASSPCRRSSPGCGPSAATRSTSLEAYPLLVHGVRLGPVALVGMPVELFNEIGSAIREGSGFGTTLVSGYWNGYRNYLPTDAERAARRLRDRHLALPARGRRARHRRCRPGSRGACNDRAARRRSRRRDRAVRGRPVRDDAARRSRRRRDQDRGSVRRR